MPRIVVSAGDISGDIQAARVIKEIKKRTSDIEISGMGSDCLRQEGVNVIIDPTEISTIGFKEAFDNFKIHYQHLQIMKDFIDKNQPDVLFLVDYSGFNMLLARAAGKRDIPVVNYFAPSAWIWGRWRAKWMARTEALIASVFPMERNVYLEAGARVEFVGHPLLDIVRVKDIKRKIYKKLEINPKKPVIGLMPGSRVGEIRSLLPEILSAVEKLNKKYGNKSIQFILPTASGIDKQRIRNIISEHKVVIKLVENYTYEVMEISDLMIIASGTATLEAAIINTPMIIIYKTSPSTYYLGKYLSYLDSIGLPNIIANNKIVPELIQNDVSGDKISEKVSYFLKKPYLLKGIEKKLAKVEEMLGEKGATARTADLVLREGAIQYD